MTAVAAGDELLKGGTSGGGGTTTPRQQQPPPPPEQGLRCPRCDSPNTKFCYYNNYSLSQPRHFCKTCRRYWTKGGTLRNIPIGGGCRRNKRSRSTTSRVSLNLRGVTVNASIDQQQSSARLGRFLGGGGAMVMSSPIGGVTSADYQPGAAAGSMPPPRLNIPAVGQYVPFVEWSSGPTAVDLTGGGGNSSAAAAMRSTIASFIESQSFINQDLHWKLQQQRLSTVSLAQPTSSAAGHTAPRRVGAGAFMQISAGAPVMEPMPTVTSWIMDSSCVFLSPPQPANTTSAVMATTTPNCNINSGLSSGDHATFNNSCDVGTIPTWGNIVVDVYNATVKHGDDQDRLRLGRLILKE